MNKQFPIGPFEWTDAVTERVAAEWIKEIEELPALLRRTVESLTNEQLDTPYRNGGWTVRQLVHHVADSHMNAYIRFKLALTEELPVIKPYDEAAWAELPDSSMPVDVSLVLLESLHKRWTRLLSELQTGDLEKTFIHPDSGEVTVGENIGMYAWHGRHHLAHITSLCDRNGWK
ncbi:bacillithiol transferase BstA [Domibacillus sp. A3M-37]|uniref:YfiT family bacillithiol transferase n=1 Tax=Domibacillus sp. A3M-37 TaxID=2962037 RepID=UPI0020B7125E|nr:bacillithiol transferase BstA [Domibacillus sp. A3M-37]MCP3760921.1 bacillithiol transferase BstA [Domibacillus sp. A3M-37]